MTWLIREHAAQESIKADFEDLQRRRLHMHCGHQKIFLLLCQHQKIFLISRWNSLYSSLCTLYCVARHHWRVWHHSVDTLPYTLVRSPPSLLQVKQSQFSQPFLIRGILQFSNHFHGSSLDFLQHVRVSNTGEPRNGQNTAGSVSPGLSRGRRSPSLTCWWQYS